MQIGKPLLFDSMSIKETLKHTKAYTAFLRMHRLHEIRIFWGEFFLFIKEARCRFKSEKPVHGSYKDYKKAFWRHRVTYSEYMYSYEFWHLNERERDKFISTSEMQVIYRKLGRREVRELFHDKVRFLSAFNSYVHRWWAPAKSMSFVEFKAKASEFDIIAKPIDGTRGNGIFKIVGNNVEDWRQLYNKLVREDYLLEQCIIACNELAAFHPASLNTIRVVTISNGDRCEVFGALLRMGTHGSVIDNTHMGGVYAPINIETGTIDIPAIDAHNNHYDFHPDTGKLIKGFHIPDWENIVATCKKASQTFPDIHFVGWDLCINQTGQVEIIEGNHAPDFDGGMQAPLKIGVKKKLQKITIDVMGVDPIKLISVWN